MNIQQLKSIIAVADHRTFSRAGESLCLSHSTISLHVRALEKEIGVALVNRSVRPAALTDNGVTLVSKAREISSILDGIKCIGSDDSLVGSLTIGVVPSTMVNLLPPVLASIRKSHPRLQIHVKTSLSAMLAQQVRSRELDIAVVTAPDAPLVGLTSHTIASESLVVIAPHDAEQSDYVSLLNAYPLIWFNRSTWAGQQIEGYLYKCGIDVHGATEVDSLEAIESMVRHGLGVSIVPKRIAAPSFSKDIAEFTFGSGQFSRELTLIERPGNAKRRLSQTMLKYLRRVAGSDTDA